MVSRTLSHDPTVTEQTAIDRQLINHRWLYLMTSPCHPSRDSTHFRRLATQAYNYRFVTAVTVIDSLVVPISFNSAYSSLHPDSLVITFDAGISA